VLTGCVMSHMRMSHVAHMNESCPTHASSREPITIDRSCGIEPHTTATSETFVLFFFDFCCDFEMKFIVDPGGSGCQKAVPWAPRRLATHDFLVEEPGVGDRAMAVFTAGGNRSRCASGHRRRS